MFLTLPTLFLLCSSAFSLLKAIDNSPCATLGNTAFDHGGPYRLAALNQTQDASKETGVPLGLGSATPNSPGSSNRSLTTIDSYVPGGPQDAFPAFWLQDAELLWTVNSTVTGGASPVVNGTALTFVVPHDRANARAMYCGAVRNSPAGGNPGHPELAVVVGESPGSGSTRGFSLCLSAMPSFSTLRNVVVYRPTTDNGGSYDYITCYPVYIQLVTTRA